MTEPTLSLYLVELNIIHNSGRRTLDEEKL